MERKTTYKYYKPGDMARLENKLDLMSTQGWQAARPGRFRQVYAKAEGCYVHRFGYCPSPEGSGGRTRYCIAQGRRGWEKVCSRKGWILFRKPADKAAEGEQLPDEREGIGKLFGRRIKALETLRMWMLVLAAILMIGGYVTDLLPVLYSSVLPLFVALIATYLIKFMEEGLRK